MSTEDISCRLRMLSSGEFFGFAGKDTDVVDEALDELLVSMRCAADGFAALVDGDSWSQFDLQFVFLVHPLSTLQTVSINVVYNRAG